MKNTTKLKAILQLYTVTLDMDDEGQFHLTMTNKTMRNFFLVISIWSCGTAYAQLPPAAQALYDSAYAQDSAMVNFTLNKGAQVLATPDGNSFYIKWFPTGSNPANTPLVVSLHGSGGYAFHEFYNWYFRAQAYGCGIVALQWYRGPGTAAPNDYFDDDALYTDIDSALKKIPYPAGKALFHGFSRGSARSYAIIFKDMHGGKNYFCTAMSNAGGADANYPLYAQIDSGIYGANVFAGKHWTMFCGGQDTTASAMCPDMINTKTWLQGQGATVDIFIQDPNLGHNGFQLQTSSAYRDSILQHYLQCFNGTLAVEEENKSAIVTISPNPFSTSAALRITNGRIANSELLVYDVFGRKANAEVARNSETFIFRKGGLNAGIYFYRILEENTTLHTGTLIIAD